MAITHFLPVLPTRHVIKLVTFISKMLPWEETAMIYSGNHLQVAEGRVASLLLIEGMLVDHMMSCDTDAISYNIPFSLSILQQMSWKCGWFSVFFSSTKKVSSNISLSLADSRIWDDPLWCKRSYHIIPCSSRQVFIALRNILRWDTRSSRTRWVKKDNQSTFFELYTHMWFYWSNFVLTSPNNKSTTN